MTRPGPKPRPQFAVVRDGNPSQHTLKATVVLPPSALVEPDWTVTLPGAGDEVERAREVASTLWRHVAPVMARSVGLVREQQESLVEYCVTYARIDQGERALSADGVVIPAGRSDRGLVRNPWTTVLNQYRSHFRSLAGELG